MQRGRALEAGLVGPEACNAWVSDQDKPNKEGAPRTGTPQRQQQQQRRALHLHTCSSHTLNICCILQLEPCPALGRYHHRLLACTLVVDH